jgi:AcrR family transcriptional regulator
VTNRERILSTARQLSIDSGFIPSLDAIAAAAAVSKGGLMHHFRTRAALVEGLATQAIGSMDEALTEAAGNGRAVETWLRLSMSRDDADLYRVLLMSFADAGARADSLLQQSAAASQRWEGLLAAELGDPMAASMIRLLGDGMVMNTLTGGPLPSLDAVLGWLEPRRTVR